MLSGAFYSTFTACYRQICLSEMIGLIHELMRLTCTCSLCHVVVKSMSFKTSRMLGNKIASFTILSWRYGVVGIATVQYDRADDRRALSRDLSPRESHMVELCYNDVCTMSVCTDESSAVSTKKTKKTDVSLIWRGSSPISRSMTKKLSSVHDKYVIHWW